VKIFSTQKVFSHEDTKATKEQEVGNPIKTTMHIYLDNCYFNRPFDDQKQKELQKEFQETRIQLSDSNKTVNFNSF
jgi:hypothetical protein